MNLACWIHLSMSAPMSTEQHERAMSHWDIARENVTTVSDWGTKRKWTESVKTQARTPLTPTAQAKAQQAALCTAWRQLRWLAKA